MLTTDYQSAPFKNYPLSATNTGAPNTQYHMEITQRIDEVPISETEEGKVCNLILDGELDSGNDLFKFFGCSFNPHLQYNSAFGDFIIPKEEQKHGIRQFLFENWPVVS
jgi:hypothetical protein